MGQRSAETPFRNRPVQRLLQIPLIQVKDGFYTATTRPIRSTEADEYGVR